MADFVKKYSLHGSLNTQHLAAYDDKFINPPKPSMKKMDKLQKDAYNNKRFNPVRAGVKDLKEMSEEFGNKLSNSVLDLLKTLQSWKAKQCN